MILALSYQRGFTLTELLEMDLVDMDDYLRLWGEMLKE